MRRSGWIAGALILILALGLALFWPRPRRSPPAPVPSPTGQEPRPSFPAESSEPSSAALKKPATATASPRPVFRLPSSPEEETRQEQAFFDRFDKQLEERNFWYAETNADIGGDHFEFAILFELEFASGPARSPHSIVWRSNMRYRNARRNEVWLSSPRRGAGGLAASGPDSATRYFAVHPMERFKTFVEIPLSADSKSRLDILEMAEDQWYKSDAFEWQRVSADEADRLREEINGRN